MKLENIIKIVCAVLGLLGVIFLFRILATGDDDIKMAASMGDFSLISPLISLSMFILFMFVMIEIAPILTKLMSSKGPYENLILEFEKKFEVNYLKALDNFDHERLKNKKMKEMSTRYEIKSKEKQIQDIVKKDAYDRYEKIRSDLEKKISKN